MYLKNAWFFFFLATAFSVFGQTGQTNSIEVDADGTVHIDTPKLLVNDMELIPRGAIIMWSGAKVPDGWILCDGTTFKDSDGETIVTPNLCGRFIVGYAPADSDYAKIGNAAGLKAVTLSTNEMPSHIHGASAKPDGSHSHSFPIFKARYHHEGTFTESTTKQEDTADQWSNGSTYGAGTHSHTISVEAAGNGWAHENRPPYYVLAYIMKIKGKGPEMALPR